MKVFRYAPEVPLEPASPLPALLVAGLLVALWLTARRVLRGHPSRLGGGLLGALVLIAAAVAGSALARGGVMVPLDLLRGTASFATLPAPAPHGNYLQHDLLVLIAPALHQVRAALAAGEWPLWNPLLGAGMPLLADPQSQAWQPLTLVALMVPTLDAFAVLAALRTAIACAGAFALWRLLGIGRTASLAGAIVYALGGFLQLWLGWPLANVATWLPALLWALLWQEHARSPGPATALLAVAVAALLASGHPESILHAGLVCVAVAAWRLAHQPLDHRLRLAARYALAGGVGLALAAPALLPAARYLPTSKRAALLGARAPSPTDDDAARRLAPVVAVAAFGNDRYLQYWGPTNVNEDASGFAGTPALLLAALTLTGAGRSTWPRGERWLVLSLLAGSLLVVARPPPLGALLRALPLAAQSSADHQRMLLVVLLALAWLAARTLDGVQVVPPARTRLLAVAGALAALLVALYLAYPPPPPGTLAAYQSSWLARQLKFLAAGTALLWLSRAGRWRRLATVAVVLLAALELRHAFGGSNPALPRALAQQTPPGLAAVRAAQAASGDARLLAQSRTLPINVASLWGFAEARLHNPAAPWAFVRTFGALDDPGFVAADDDAALLDRLGISLLLARPRDPAPRGFAVRYRDARVVLWARSGPTGLVTLEPGGRVQAQNPGPARLAFATRGARRATVAVAATAGWRALVDGQPQPLTDDGALLAITLPERARRVVLTYRPAGLLPAALLAAVGIAMLAAWSLPAPRRRAPPD